MIILSTQEQEAFAVSAIKINKTLDDRGWYITNGPCGTNYLYGDGKVRRGCGYDKVSPFYSSREAAEAYLEIWRATKGMDDKTLLRKIIAEFDATSEDGSWDEGHPIFCMAQTIDSLTARVRKQAKTIKRLRREQI